MRDISAVRTDRSGYAEEEVYCERETTLSKVNSDPSHSNISLPTTLDMIHDIVLALTSFVAITDFVSQFLTGRLGNCLMLINVE